MSASKFPNPFIVSSYPLWPPPSSPSRVFVDNARLFLQKDMNPGAETKEVILARTITGTTFLPYEEADSLPFSSAKLAQILDRLAVVPGSAAAKHIEKTLRDCETPSSDAKFCATSLESMINFVSSELGDRDLKVVATTVHGKDEHGETTYKIAAQAKELPGNKFVACHPRPYPYSVYYCHVEKAIKAYVVPLVRKDGAMLSTVAVCHFDTSEWNPIFFQVLKVKPGTKPICHFLPQDHLLWTPNK